jgi:hypothetical protein
VDGERTALGFGKLIGIYVVFSFLIAQLISWLVFEQISSLNFAIGGTLHRCRGVVISMAKS